MCDLLLQHLQLQAAYICPRVVAVCQELDIDARALRHQTVEELEVQALSTGRARPEQQLLLGHKVLQQPVSNATFETDDASLLPARKRRRRHKDNAPGGSVYITLEADR